MSTQALKARITTPAKKPISERTLADLLNDKAIKEQIKRALPKQLEADRFMRVMLTELRTTPALANCSPESFLSALMQSAQLGLEVGNGLGHAYLIPFGNGKDTQGRANVQLIIGYRGMLDLIKRSGQVSKLSVRAVHEKDDFHYEYGLNEDMKHLPTIEAETGELTYVYAVVHMKDGTKQFEVMSRKQIEEIRLQSKASGASTWKNHFEEMAKKTVVRRLFKYMPISVEMERAIILDERAEANMDQQTHILFEDDSIIDMPTNPEPMNKETLSDEAFNEVLEQISTGSIEISDALNQYELTAEQHAQIDKL